MRVALLIAGLALVGSVAHAGEVGRFRPATPGYVVLKVPASASNDPIAVLEQRHAREPQDEAVASQLAEMYVARARAEREPRYFARAEALVKPWALLIDARDSTSGLAAVSTSTFPAVPTSATLAPSATAPTLAATLPQIPAVRVSTLRVQADILQNRHDFAGAMKLLDRAIELSPRDASARLMRASVKLVGGHAAEARSDCAGVLAAGDSMTGTICLAQVLAATGGLARADALLKTLLARDEITFASASGAPSMLSARAVRAGTLSVAAAPVVPASAPSATTAQAAQMRGDVERPVFSASRVGTAATAPVRAWALWVLADFADRAGDSRAAESNLRGALAADPQSEGIRSALSDLLLDRGAYREALSLVDLPAPSIGLLARRARAQQLVRDPALEDTRSQIDALVTLAARRADPPHLREEALVALDIDHDTSRALELAKANFATQRETIDIRLLIRAARATGDTATLRSVAQWIRETGYEDRQLRGATT